MPQLVSDGEILTERAISAEEPDSEFSRPFNNNGIGLVHQPFLKWQKRNAAAEALHDIRNLFPGSKSALLNDSIVPPGPVSCTLKLEAPPVVSTKLPDPLML